MGFVRIAAAFACCLIVILAPSRASAQQLTTIPGVTGQYVAVNPVTHRAYVADAANLVVLDGTTRSATLPLPSRANFMLVDTALNRIYTLHDDQSLTVVDGVSHEVRGLATNVMTPIVVSARTGTLYVRSTLDKDIRVFDAAGNRSTIALPFAACGMALNDATGQLYVSHCVASASVIDLGSGAIATIPFPGVTSAWSVAVNTATNRPYVASTDGNSSLLVIDGTSRTGHVLNNVASASQRGPLLAVSSADNRIYVTWATQVSVIDGATDTVVATTATQSDVLINFRLDSVRNKVYALAFKSLVGFDAAGGTSTTLLPFRPSSLDIDAPLQRVYVVSTLGALLVELNGPASPPRLDYQGMWWNAPGGSESGWGVDIAQQGDIVFAAWFTYDEGGDPVWFVMPRGERTSDETFSGPLYTTSGPEFSAPVFDPSSVTTRVVGTMAFRFSDANNGVMEAAVNGTRVTKPITRQVFASPVPTCETSDHPGIQNFTDLFWNPNESGWGTFITHQGDNLFTVWFTYVSGKPSWFVASNVAKVAAQSSGRTNTYSGTLYRTTGPSYTGPFDRSRVSPTAIGEVTLRFVDDAAQFNWAVGSLSGQKSIVREVFSYPRSLCH